MDYNQAFRDRFWSKVDRADGCWLWRGGNNGRYGTCRVGKRTLGAHRVSWALAHGEEPGELQVLHRCDTPLCVRPDHLFLGTQLDNITDMHRKRRWKGKGDWAIERQQIRVRLGLSSR